MKIITLLIIALNFSNILLAQTSTLKFVPNAELSGRKYLIIYESVTEKMDTISECPASYSIHDFFIKTPDSLSIIFNIREGFFFQQMIKNLTTNEWIPDYTAAWTEQPHANYSTQQGYGVEKYKILEYDKVVRIENNQQVSVELPLKKWNDGKKRN